MLSCFPNSCRCGSTLLSETASFHFVLTSATHSEQEVSSFWSLVLLNDSEYVMKTSTRAAEICILTFKSVGCESQP